MRSSRAAAAYRQTEVQVRSPLELVVMLYDGALRFLQQGRDAHARGDRGARARAVSRVLAILSECQNTLNLAEGGAIAQELDRLYTYMNVRLLAINTSQDASAFDEVHGLLSTLRDGWAQAATAPPAASAAKP